MCRLTWKFARYFTLSLFYLHVLFIWLPPVFVVLWDLLLQRADSLALVRGLSCPEARGILVPQSAIEPLSPAFQSGFLTTGPLGMSHFIIIF